MGRFVVMVLACVAGMSVVANATECRFAKKTTVHNLPGNFVLRLTPMDDKRTGDGCRADLVDAKKKVVFSVADWDLALVVSGQDVNGDGTPDIVLEGYSGGAHCCWTYHIVSLGVQPQLLVKFENERGAGFRINQRTGRMEIKGQDGSFDYFDSFAHAFSPFPDVYLRLEGKTLIDISREHRTDYDGAILKLKKEIPEKDLAVFVQAENAEEKGGWEEVSSKVVSVVLAYLYSGREQQAHDALKKMWPAFDQDRMWKLILETRRKGILRYTRSKTS